LSLGLLRAGGLSRGAKVSFESDFVPAREEPKAGQQKGVQMSILEFLVLLLIAGICGSLAQSLVGYSHGGCLVSIALGFIGALLGTWIARAMKLPDLLNIQLGNQTFPVIWSIIGAALFAAVLSLITRRPRPVV
jgi:uncharacterized membrane protein YeaQ/YmgE (transglycosylase-associated protein family)